MKPLRKRAISYHSTPILNFFYIIEKDSHKKSLLNHDPIDVNIELHLNMNRKTDSNIKEMVSLLGKYIKNIKNDNHYDIYIMNSFHH